MNSAEIWLLVCGASAALGGLVLLLSNIEKLCGYGSRYSKWRRRQFAKRQQPFCQEVCVAPKYMVEIQATLTKLVKDIEDTKAVSLRTLGDNLNRKCQMYQKQGWMPQDEKNQMMAEFITYWLADGNGNVLYQVGITMNLPVEEGGKPFDIDMSIIIEREVEKHLFKNKKEDKP
jgi:hypothetical protein